MKAILVFAIAILATVEGSSQKTLTQKQLFDHLLTIYKKRKVTEGDLKRLFHRLPTDTIQYATKEFIGYKKYAVYFYPDQLNNRRFNSLVVPIQQLPSVYQSSKIFLSPKATMWDLFVKNGRPKAFETLRKSDGIGVPDNLFSFNYGFESHEFLSAPLSKDDLDRLKTVPFIYQEEKFTPAQLQLLKAVLEKIPAAYAHFYAPFDEADDVVPAIQDVP